MNLRLLALGTALAAPLLTRGALDEEFFPRFKVGRFTYTNVTVTSATETHVYFTYSGGMDMAKLKDLDPGLQKHFHYDAGTAAATESAQAQSSALYRQALTQPAGAASSGQAPASGQAASPPSAPNADNDGIPPHQIHAKSFLRQYAPELKVEKWLTPAPNTAGKFLLVDFWATWCGPCRQSIPHLNTLAQTFPEKLTVVGLSEEPEDQVKRMTSPLIKYSVAIDTGQRMKSAVEVRGIPHALLIDPKGIVRFEGHPEYLTAAILKNLLARYSR